MFNLIPILAAGGTAISVLFLVIAFISWLWNVFNSNQNAPAAGRRPQPQPPGGKKLEAELQAEIKRFLNNVMGQKPEPEDELEVLVVEEEVEPQRPRQKPRSKAEAAKRKSAAAATKAAPAGSEGPDEARPGGRIAQRKGPGSTTLGSGVRQHVAEHMQEGRVRQQAEAHLAHGVAEQVEKDLGTFSTVGLPSTKSDRPNPAAAVVKMMRDPVGVKQAFVLNLILNRPSFGKRR